MIRRLRVALPGRRETLIGALAWGLLLMANAILGLLLRGWSGGPIAMVALLFLAGGLLAFPPALFAARFLALGRGRAIGFAATFLCLAAASVAVTGGLYALQYRTYYAQWHDAAFTRIWTIEFVFTCLVALYQFAVLGVRLMLPLGFLGLFAASWLFARDTD